MRCPFCAHDDTQVKDSRPTEDSSATRRRRFCTKCEQRFTTFERVQLREMTVLKGGGRKQPFDRDKIIRSMQVALRKRPVELEQIEAEANQIVRTLEAQGEAEIHSDRIGELVMEALTHLDAVGYIRFASVYKDFRDPKDFNDFLSTVTHIKDTKNGQKKKA
ncbi:MAG: transcriptional repressor NrdR [Alphaproteobacteria bacterium]|nr:transcriptional repressor NrdR [Alphaproteobacteria bacterium]